MELVAAPQAVPLARISGAASTSSALSKGLSVRSPATTAFFGCKLQSLPLQLAGRQARSLQVCASKKTFSSFDELLQKSDRPVLVDFYATWCGPCQFMVPILGEVQTAMKDEITVVKIDSEKYSDLASKYSIEALPTFILFKNGSPVDRFEGALPAAKLMERIRGVLSSCKAGV
ncbi:thioredoxin Y, chloroplastic [Selaginella moellendorffii]|uniref:thioredoxin Y, chloroplastic n=1 Tax=Selaginella moellendorffii TaxID=88036 RepID=UPI000D1CD9BA|nr:thioredoxin Y, chloroplastic [Selaginella moellendorffii]XP_002967468.2 thioredoxin Y, chloroplastic [Selaginella moellendorffii]|eukprot:XP_002960245.2 thioredoxin Y, chloroplastic [Selaginella moellendorffii]